MVPRAEKCETRYVCYMHAQYVHGLLLSPHDLPATTDSFSSSLGLLPPSRGYRWLPCSPLRKSSLDGCSPHHGSRHCYDGDGFWPRKYERHSVAFYCSPVCQAYCCPRHPHGSRSLLVDSISAHKSHTSEELFAIIACFLASLHTCTWLLGRGARHASRIFIPSRTSTICMSSRDSTRTPSGRQRALRLVGSSNLARSIACLIHVGRYT